MAFQYTLCNNISLKVCPGIELGQRMTKSVHGILEVLLNLLHKRIIYRKPCNKKKILEVLKTFFNASNIFLSLQGFL